MDDLREKVPYAPSEIKRWDISADPISRERINSLHNVFKEVGDELTYKDSQTGEMKACPIAVVVGGSLSKGKTLTEETKVFADIDFDVYYDYDELVKHADEISVFHPDGIFAKEYHRKLKEVLANRSNLNDYRTGKEDKDFMDHIIISTGARALFIENIDKNLQNVDDTVYNIFAIQMDGKYSIYSRVKKEYDRGIDISTSKRGGNPQEYQVARFFQLDVGGGMKKYIQAFLNKINEHPQEERDKIWDFVRNAVEKTERGGNIPETMKDQYPQTYEDARKFYGL